MAGDYPSAPPPSPGEMPSIPSARWSSDSQVFSSLSYAHPILEGSAPSLPLGVLPMYSKVNAVLRTRVGDISILDPPGDGKEGRGAGRGQRGESPAPGLFPGSTPLMTGTFLTSPALCLELLNHTVPSQISIFTSP